MIAVEPEPNVEWIPLDRIEVVNPRSRGRRAFKEMVDNIGQIGLKRPITVRRRKEAQEEGYELVCGQGRLEAYRVLGQKEVPAFVVAAEPEDCLIASLVENCARRQHSAIDLLQDIGGMRQRGYSVAEIAQKTGLSAEYVHGVARLLEQGEQRLLQSVEARALPISVALEIAEAEDQDVQRALQNAYDAGLLRGRRLIAAKRLIEARRQRGKQIGKRDVSQPEKLSTAGLVRAYRQDAERKREMIRRANATKDRLMLVIEAVRRLLRDDGFTALLAAEGLDTMPEKIAARVAGKVSS
ncbi:ParB/RepB/Spo0J family partition protein [Sphingosinicella sp. BN140058]|uniref:ParB/RepB/Spo0J family partition protein n=1 Tax=Sphingosinicella sp. BN140058 TaxID=1892855 RepID=UPI00101126CF|nr:plasmid partitioning protein RepB C-terminal domain-containing protein [Sphingosinicella sp. BN140058]QAY78081.1 chromosome partitioning protein ParB [Sphingosinicella sp. BN140058]